jgi:hypothetical protein
MENRNRMIDINPILLKVSLDISGLNTPIKTEKLPEMNKKQDPTIYYLKETDFTYKNVQI